MAEFNFIGPDYASLSYKADAQRVVNLFLEGVESGSGAAKKVFFGTPGLLEFCTLDDSPVRGLWAGEGRLFAAAGTSVYEIDDDGNATAFTGAIEDDAEYSPVEM